MPVAISSRVPPPSAWVPHTWVGLIALIAVTVRLPFVTQRLGSDEGGFLLVASQWSPGTSLYGNYWVDRPPLLLDFFALAGHLGGTIALRLLGAGLVAVSVLLAGRIGALAAERCDASTWTPVLTAATAAIFLVDPLFGAMEVDGELIAVALVLLSTERLLRAHSVAATRSTTWLLATAGAAAAAAVLVKQNEVDALVVMAVLAWGAARRQGLASSVGQVGAAALGAIVCASLVLAHALTLGTTLPGLWEAVVSFRIRASDVISASATPATTGRLATVSICLVVSGAPAIVALLARCLRGRPTLDALDLPPPAMALLGWESLSVLAGGSYWLHYLVVLVPGLVLAAAAVCASTTTAVAAPSRGRRAVPPSLVAVLTYALLVSTAAVGVMGLRSHTTGDSNPVATWLATHKRPGDTAVIAYGHPDVLQASGLSSPYPELWSLPVKVRDPHLNELTRLLAGTSRPDWVVTTGQSLDAWGLDASRANAELSSHYSDVADIDGSHIFHQLRPQTTVTAVSTP